MAGNTRGSVIFIAVLNFVAPDICELSSSEASIDFNAPDVKRKTKGTKYKLIVQMMPQDV